MCGIVGIISEKEVSPLLLDAIRRLEYRGYDSVGMVCIHQNKLSARKDAGKIAEVDAKLDFSSLKGAIGLAHSRWATHGGVTRANAHPHYDCKQNIALVHNGIVENYDELKKELQQRGHSFSSDTDTEVIAHLIEENEADDILDATRKALHRLEGSYAIGVISTKNADELIAARKESPLVIGIGDRENFIASDIPAILPFTKKVIFLENGEIARLTREKVEVFGLDGIPKKKTIVAIDWDAKQAEKQGYPHFMLKEIFEQPFSISETIGERMSEQDILLDKEIQGAVPNPMEIKRLIIVACGTSWHAGLIGEFMLEELAKIPTEVEYASEFRYRDPIIPDGTAVIAISQSGETADTIAALREAKKKGAKVIAVVNVEGSTIARESDSVLFTHAGPEIGVASTKAFTSQLTMLYLLTVYLAEHRGILPQDQIRNRIRDLRKIPHQVQEIVENQESIKELAELFFRHTNALYLGRGINYPIALEGALKLKEVSYLHAEGYPAAEMKHGPIALIDEKMPVVVIATKDTRTYTKVLSNIAEVKARGGIVIAIASAGDNEIKEKVDHVLYIPENSYILTPLLAAVPLQLFAYYVAVLDGKDPDKPVNLAKSVTVE
ncbi:glutamine--fructose-6-phosphate transaminase (isomerizing) [Candidatus Woesearchaeota archaeon]|nr:glutamine--fructose-6-phosphate transaminase (isomerizing) [Candidatus Woesearchaeota archaeon]